MKKTIRTLAFLLALMLCVGLLPVAADELWNEDYYRAYDLCDVLSEEERDDLDNDCIEFMKQFETDLFFIIASPDDYEDEGMEYMVDYIYNDCSFGYGRTGDALAMVYDVEEPSAQFFTFGHADQLLDQMTLEDIAENALGYEEEYDHWGVCYAAVSMLTKNLESRQGETSEPVVTAGASDRVGEESSMPAWYPADPQNFPLYYDENAPRVVDTADIFTDDEEARLESRLGEIRQELDRDIVVFTDVSTYGLSRAVYAADFYDFNGYGCGPDHEGVCLMICMDPNDRGWWTCCTGPVTRGLYTEQYANDIDDVLYEFLADGEYYEGVSDWVENMRTLYVKGVPFAPDWMPELSTFQHTNDLTRSRLVDSADLLSDDEEAALLQKAAALSEKYGVDVVMHTTRSTQGMTTQTYSDQFYYYNNYGFGQNFDGILLTLNRTGGVTARVSAEGAGAKNLTEVNEERLTDRAASLAEGSAYKAFDWWLGQVDHMYRTGRVSRSLASWGIWTAVQAAFSSLAGLIGLGCAKSKMKTAKVKTNADSYLVRDRLDVRPVRDTYLHTTVTRRYDPVKTKSSGGGGSSYSSSYHGSSGSSHSGSGRSF